jgi:hypothetical protein
MNPYDVHISALFVHVAVYHIIALTVVAVTAATTTWPVVVIDLRNVVLSAIARQSLWKRVSLHVREHAQEHTLIASPAALYDRYVKNIKIRNSSC